MIELFLMIIASLLLGYYLGSKHTPKRDAQSLMKTLEDIKPFKEQFTPGPIQRPSAHDLYMKNQPQSVQDSKQAVKEVFDAIPELQEAKKALQ